LVSLKYHLKTVALHLDIFSDTKEIKPMLGLALALHMQSLQQAVLKKSSTQTLHHQTNGRSKNETEETFRG